MTTTAIDPSVHKRRWLILGVLVLSLLVVVLDSSILNVALKTIADPVRGLGASETDLEWATNAYTLAFAGLLFTWGVLGDRIGRKKLLLIGMTVFGLGSLASAYAQTPGDLIIARIVMGVGGAAVMPTTLAIISNVFEPKERPKAIGIWSGAVGIAIAVGPITGGVLLQHFWWGSVFLVNIPIVLLAVALMLLLVPDSKNPAPGRFDPVGVPLSIAGITAFVYGIIRAGDIGWLRPEALGIIAAGVLLLILFVLWERRTDHPALNVKLFRHKSFSAAVSVVGLVFLALMGLTFFLSFYMQAVRGFSPLKCGLLLIPLAAAQLIFSSRSAALVQRLGHKTVTATGMALVTLALGSYFLVDATTPIWHLEIALFAMGTGMANVMPPATAAVMASVPREKAGEGSAISNTVRQVGGALGVAVLGSILTSAYRGRMTPILDAVPALHSNPATVKTLSGSITATQAFVEKAGPRADALVGPSNDAFVHAMHLAVAGSVAAGALGVLIALLWLPGRNALSRSEPDTTDVTAAPTAARTDERVLLAD
ncbi:MFS transporter [Streptomyces sp. PTM05]|uniref:MFS transporter n=1 Tax=Streptantibioticus parmotrematis TaxID=2873249 RepID=A0ABS7R4J1_9ACTN|nr:MFS transporter [Streptantibioticus parmotrematis]MBY8888959.1 MFS transporter [Streptantibioticus parmotrematis]